MAAPLDPYLAPRVAGAPAALVVGAMNFGKRTPRADAERIIARAIERGLTFFDTANAYADGESEKILGRALEGHAGARVATKVGFGRVSGKPEGLAPERILRAIDESLERLRRDAVDVYYLHVPDCRTPIDESIDAIGALLANGKIRAWGISNYASWQILDIFSRCDARSIARPVVSQVIYNLLIRQLDLEYFAFCAAHPIHTTIFNPLAGGLLAGRHARGEAPPGRFAGNGLYLRRYWTDRFFDLVDAYAAVAHDAGMSLLQLSYAWLAQRAGVDSILLGPASLEHLDAGIDACARGIAEATCARIDEIHRAFLGTDTTYVR